MNTRTAVPSKRSLASAPVAAFVGGLLVVAASPASAQWTLTPYIWATDLGIDVSMYDRTVVDQTIGFTELVDDLDMAFQLRVEGRFAHLGVMADVFDVRMSASESRIGLPNGAAATLDWKVRMTLLDVGGLYDPSVGRDGLTLFYGARILLQSAELDALMPVDSSTVTTVESDQTDAFVDALVGWRYTHVFAGWWMIETQGDVSTGGTKVTWSAGGRIARSFGERYTLSAGYRHMSIEFEDEPPAQIGMALSGLTLGFQIGL